jgi:HD-GYP domain-containing protein (c-di-GMP phosphodiesterase class II)
VWQQKLHRLLAATKRVGARVPRPRILWIVLGALLLVSLGPIVLYHRQVLELSQEKLAATERLQQTEVTRSLAEEINQFYAGIYQQLVSLRQILALTGMIHNVDDPVNTPQVAALLENFATSNPNILYLTALGKQAKGPWAGNYRADGDPFVSKALQRAFAATFLGQRYRGDPLALGPESRPAFVIAIPLRMDDEFSGMLAALVSLDQVYHRLQTTSVRGRTVYVVDRNGSIVAHPDVRDYVPGTDVSLAFAVVKRLQELPAELRSTQTTSFTLEDNGSPVEMIGTYSTIPELQWSVVAQRRLEDARADAGVEELNRQALTVVVVVTFAALVLGYLFAVAITAPIHSLAASTRAISRGEFHERARVRGAREVSELAETFNKMADDIEDYIARLKRAAEENRELFLGSIRMLAAAIDEKDPYTRGHSGRVAKYSVIIGEELGLDAEELDKLRISALLHDVGKIGVDDRVLKKPGALTPDEFELMKQHPVKGANIMRPVAQLKDMLPGIELHHEHIDGGGYPYGLRGEQIPLMARIIAVADTLDAITTNRPYQSAMSLDYALERIRQFVGSKFDAVVVDALEAAIQSGRLRLSPTVQEVEAEASLLA